MNTLEDCRIIELNKYRSDRRGNLSVVESCKNVPFDIRRVFYIYDVPGGESRGSHAHRTLQQIILAATGSFNVELDDGYTKKTVFLNHPDKALYIPDGIWASQTDFSAGAVALVLASDRYIEEDYIRDYNAFLSYIKENRHDKVS